MSDVESDDYSEDDRLFDETDYSDDDQEGLFDILSDSDCATDSDSQNVPKSQIKSKNSISFPLASELKECKDLVSELSKLSNKSKLERKYEDLLNLYISNLLFALDEKNKDYLSSCIVTLHKFRDFKQKMEDLLKKKSSNKNENLKEQIVENGSRPITYQMKTNKGLTPHRNKKNKNPRLKNRNKFKKALVRRKGAIPNMRKATVAYVGEQRGIDPYIVRSVKFQKKH